MLSSACRLSSVCRVVRPPVNLQVGVVANLPSFPDRDLFFSRITEVARGEISYVQLRDYYHDEETVVSTATRLKQLLPAIPLYINTPQPYRVIKRVQADGVFLEHISLLAHAKRELASSAIIGVAVKTISDVHQLNADYRIDYISLNVWRSQETSPHNHPLLMHGLRYVRSITSHRIVATGGLNVDNVASVISHLRSGDGVAMAGDIMRAKNPFETVRQMQKLWKTA